MKEEEKVEKIIIVVLKKKTLYSLRLHLINLWLSGSPEAGSRSLVCQK